MAFDLYYDSQLAFEAMKYHDMEKLEKERAEEKMSREAVLGPSLEEERKTRNRQDTEQSQAEAKKLDMKQMEEKQKREQRPPPPGYEKPKEQKGASGEIENKGRSSTGNDKRKPELTPKEKKSAEQTIKFLTSEPKPDPKLSETNDNDRGTNRERYCCLWFM